jgi:hypothetical protein
VARDPTRAADTGYRALRRHGDFSLIPAPFISSAQTPERTSETKPRQESLCFFDGCPAPAGVHLIPIPSTRKLPRLLNCEGFPPRLVPLSSPSLDVLLTPEEQHGLSSENDVFPPALRRYRKMNNSARLRKVAFMNTNRHRFATAGARSIQDGISTKHGHNSQAVPHARSKK